MAAAAVFVALCARGHAFASRADEAVFVLLARSLRAGRFASQGGLGPPVADHLPGFPALIALPSALLEGRWGLYWLLALPFAFAYAAAAYALAKRLLRSARAAAAVAALCALSPAALDLSGAVLTDLPFSALAAAVLAGVPAAPLPLLCAGVGLGALLRPQGVFLCAAAAAGAWACRGRRAALAVFASGFTPLALWLLRSRLVAGRATDYAAQWAADASRASPSAFLETAFGRGTFGLEASAGIAAGGVLLACAAAGSRLLLASPRRKEALAPALFVVFTLVVHATWAGAAPRYALPVLPALWTLAAAAAAALLAPRARNAVFAALCAGLVFRAAPLAREGLSGGGFVESGLMEYLARTPEVAKTESLSCSLVLLLSGKPATCPPAVSERDAWAGWLALQGVTHVHDFDFSQDGYLPPEVARFAALRRRWISSWPLFSRVFVDERSGAAIYAFDRDGAARVAKGWAEFEKAVALAASRRVPRARVAKVVRRSTELAPELALPWAALGELETEPKKRVALFEKAFARDPSSAMIAGRLADARDALRAARPRP